MPHGQRDWSNIGADENVHGIDDMAELAARLGSPVLFNREGNVLFLDTFENGLQPWNFVGWGTGADAIASNLWSRYGGYSCKLITGSEESGSMLAQRLFPYPVLSRYGLEFAFNIESGIKHVDVAILHYTGTNRHKYTLRIDLANDQLVIWYSGGASYAFGKNLALSTSSYSSHMLKMVVDIENNLWQRLILNDTEYDLSAYGAFSIVNAVAPEISIEITANSVAASSAAMYLDDIIITFNEP